MAERDADYQAWLDARRRSQTMPPDTEIAWLIYYDDKDMPVEVFSGCGAEDAARRRFDRQRGRWTMHLFKEVAANG